jgi:hypothetical protein
METCDLPNLHHNKTSNSEFQKLRWKEFPLSDGFTTRDGDHGMYDGVDAVLTPDSVMFLVQHLPIKLHWFVASQITSFDGFPQLCSIFSLHHLFIITVHEQFSHTRSLQSNSLR